MGKSVHGPDMLDCLQYWRQMDDQAGIRTTMLLMLSGSGAAPFVIFNLLSTAQEPDTLNEVGWVSAYAGYPSREHGTFNGAFYRALIEHDKYMSSEGFFRKTK